MNDTLTFRVAEPRDLGQVLLRRFSALKVYPRGTEPE